VDYPGFVQEGVVLDPAEYDEQLEFAQQVRMTLDQLPAHPDKANLLLLAAQLIDRIQHRAPGLDVAALAQQLRWQIIRAYSVEVAPKRPPDLRMAKALYQLH
jgi:high-affinity iron transporter